MKPSSQHPSTLWPPRQGEGRARLCCQAKLSADAPGQQPEESDSHFPIRRLAWQLGSHADKGTLGLFCACSLSSSQEQRRAPTEETLARTQKLKSLDFALFSPLYPCSPAPLASTGLRGQAENHQDILGTQQVLKE